MDNKMNNTLTIFENPEFGKIRIEVIDGEVWFIGKDIAEALGYANPKNAVPKYVDKEDKLSTQIEYAGQRRKVTLINESGLYALIFSSKLEKAKDFKRWVTSEVLPSIRKTGSYTIPMTIDQQVQIVAQGQVQLREIVEKQTEEIENLQVTVEDLQEQINVIGAYQNSYKYKELTTAISSRNVSIVGTSISHSLGTILLQSNS